MLGTGILAYMLAALLMVIMLVQALLKKTEIGNKVGIVFAGATVVTLAYTVTVMNVSYSVASLASSVFFIFIDLTLVSLLSFTVQFCDFDTEARKKLRRLKWPIFIYGIFDVAILMFNPINEIAVSYKVIDTPTGVAIYEYDQHFLFKCHLAYSYLLLICVALILIKKAWDSPKVYRAKYTNILIGLAVVVGLNAVYLAIDDFLIIDISILTYGIIALIIYWNVFYYSSSGLQTSLRKLMLEYLSRPVVMFDYDGKLQDFNLQAKEFFPYLSMDEHKITLKQFLETNEISADLKVKEKQEFYWTRPFDASFMTYLMEFSPMIDDRDSIIGYLIVLNDTTSARDYNTGFDNDISLNRKYPYWEGKPESAPRTLGYITISNINKISEEKGSRTVHNLLKKMSEIMRENVPDEAYMVRMDDDFLIFSWEADVSEMADLLEEVSSYVAEASEDACTPEMQSRAIDIPDARVKASVKKIRR